VHVTVTGGLGPPALAVPEDNTAKDAAPVTSAAAVRKGASLRMDPPMALIDLGNLP
jgi:hypothetical protein